MCLAQQRGPECLGGLAPPQLRTVDRCDHALAVDLLDGVFEGDPHDRAVGTGESRADGSNGVRGCEGAGGIMDHHGLGAHLRQAGSNRFLPRPSAGREKDFISPEREQIAGPIDVFFGNDDDYRIATALAQDVEGPGQQRPAPDREELFRQ